MKNVRTFRKLVALIALGAILSIGFVQDARAFTLVETQLLPAVQLGVLQALLASVSNFSTGSVSVTINVLNASGTIVMTKTSTVAGGKSLVIKFTNGGNTGSYSAVVEASVAGAVTSDLEVLNSNGQVAAVSLPFINTSPATQNMPGVRLIPGQSGAVTVTNITTASVQFTATVSDNSGNTVLTQSGTLVAGQTMTFPFSNAGTANNGYRAVVSAPASAVVSDLMTFDKTSGNIIVIVYPPNPC